MSELPKFNSVVEQTSREEAAALAMAASEVGARVMVLANEGETFQTKPKSSRAQSQEIAVSEGNVAIETSGTFPGGDMGQLRERQDEIHQQIVEQQPPTQAA